MSSWALVLVISLAVLLGLVMIAAARHDSHRPGVDGAAAADDGGWDAGHHHGGGHNGDGDFGGGDFGGGGGGHH